METPTHSPLQRHPKCSALYASRVRRDSVSAKSVDSISSNIAALANVTVEVTTKTLARESSIFAVTVHDHKSSSTWRHLRSYEECRTFQSRVLKTLSRGHLCFAECPWLYAYVQRALPAERTGHHLFRVAGHCPRPRVVENQRQALARLFATLQRVLLNPLNQKCSVLMGQVASEVMTFITNRSEEDVQKALNSPTSDRPLAKTFSESFIFEIEEKVSEDEQFGQSSTTTTSSIEDLDEDVAVESDPVQNLEKVVAGQRVCCAMCALHQKRSDEQVFACWRAETMSSRFMRLRAGAGAERTSIVAKRQSPELTQVKTVWESPAYSQRVTSPLEPLAVLGGCDSEVNVMTATEHDGTPKDPFPGSPGTPEPLATRLRRRRGPRQSARSISTCWTIGDFRVQCRHRLRDGILRLKSRLPSRWGLRTFVGCRVARCLCLTRSAANSRLRNTEPASLFKCNTTRILETMNLKSPFAALRSCSCVSPDEFTRDPFELQDLLSDQFTARIDLRSTQHRRIKGPANLRWPSRYIEPGRLPRRTKEF